MNTPSIRPLTAAIRAGLEDRADRELAMVKQLAAERRARKPAQEHVVHDAVEHVELIRAADLKPEPIRWLWPEWLAKGKLHVLAGAPGTGKTTLALDLAACITSGRALPSGRKPPCGSVLIWSGEDDPKDTLVPRLLAAGADLRRVHIVGDVRGADGPRPFDPARDVDQLAAACAGIDDIALLIVDPLVSAVAGDSHKNAEVRRGLAPLVDLASRLDAALLGITHYSKGTQGREPLERVSGSLAFGALARVVLGTVRQPGEDEADRKLVLARAKSNIGPDGGGLAYAFEQVEVPGHPGLTASRIVWGAQLEGTARELLAEPQPEGDTQGDAAAFLRDLLAGGSMAAKDVQREARDFGLTDKQLRSARERLGIKPRKAGMGAGWIWALPAEDAPKMPKMPNLREGHLRAERASSGAIDPVEVAL